MQYYLSLGSNLGHREQTLHDALKLIHLQIGSVTRCSSFFYSEPWGFASIHPFCNLCCLVETDLMPVEMLRATQSIERTLGREHKSAVKQTAVTAQEVESKQLHYADRSIDIDLIRAFDDNGNEVFFRSESLMLPHLLWQQRPFVVLPLQEIGAPAYNHES